MESSDRVLITGDFNLHMDCQDDVNAKRFTDILESFDLKQRVCAGTHRNGHTLDLLINKSDDNMLNNIKVYDPNISDHSAVMCDVSIRKPQFRKEVIFYRKLRSLDMESFLSDVADCPLVIDPSSDLDHLVQQYDTLLRSIMDKYAPVKRRVVTIRPAAPWYTNEVSVEKSKRRRLERKWRRTRLQADRQEYTRQCCVVNNLIKSLKSSYYTTIITENSTDQRVLFNTVSKLLQKQSTARYPSSCSDALANSFADYFIDKIDRIHATLIEKNSAQGKDANDVTLDNHVECNSVFSDFINVSYEDIKGLALRSINKSCVLDPLPAVVMKECFNLLTPVLTSIVNTSLSTGVMPDVLKIAAVTPTLKKHNADFTKYESFRPISNLKFVSKLVEKAVCVQLTAYITSNGLSKTFQSAYKSFHSTETALLRVQNDILCALDRNESVILVLLDLSAAFDTVDHTLLVTRLSTCFGFHGTVLKWLKSYLSSRKLFVKVGNSHSSQRALKCGVPQGSVLGPLLYLLYTSPIADIINDHGLSYHLYADDTQLYITFKSTSLNDIQQVKLRVECCVRDIDEWMIRNYLKLNQDKTDLVVISSRFHPMPDIGHITVGSECITPRDSVRNLGVQFDSIFSFEEHIKNICKSSFYHLRNIAKIRKYLSQDTCEILVPAFISSKLDHCNSLLHGLPKYLLARLQAVQNAAARVVTLTPKHVHITPILINLHWLPVEFRITFKVLLLVYKALHGLAPSYISDLLNFKTYSRSLRSSCKDVERFTSRD